MGLSRGKQGKNMKNYDNPGVFLVRDKETSKPLFFSWKFDDGTTQRVKYDSQEEWCIFLEQSLREEHAQDVKHDRHRARFNKGMELDIEDIPDKSTDAYVDDETSGEDTISSFLSSLTETQLRRYQLKEEHPEYTLCKIAELEGVDVSSIFECFRAIQKKFKKFFQELPPKIDTKCV